MKILTVDFETYYDREYSLLRLTTEEYVRSDKFEVIGVAVKERYRDWETDRKSTRLNSSHSAKSRMPSSA